MTPVFTMFALVFLLIAVLTNNVGMAAIGAICAFAGF